MKETASCGAAPASVPVIMGSPHRPRLPSRLTPVLWFWLHMTPGVHLFCGVPLPTFRQDWPFFHGSFSDRLLFPSSSSVLHRPLSAPKNDLCEREILCSEPCRAYCGSRLNSSDSPPRPLTAQPTSLALQASLVFLTELHPAPAHTRHPRHGLCAHTCFSPGFAVGSPCQSFGPPCLRPPSSYSDHCSSQG